MEKEAGILKDGQGNYVNLRNWLNQMLEEIWLEAKY